jgi:CubicO group peptidase (beta-lactamase class C family)
MKPLILTILLPALALGVTLITPPQSSPQWRAIGSDSLRRIVTERVASGRSSGVIVGVLEGGRPRFVAAGLTGGPGSPPIDQHTVFEIGSISKVFTTTLLADQVSRGRVKLDDPAARYLPNEVAMPSRGGRPITLLDLATATSGLPRIPDGFTPADLTNPYADYAERHLYDFLARHQLGRDPGTAYEYSNLGMGLLGHILGRVAGSGYLGAVTERVLQPLGMTETVTALPAHLAARFAQGHGADLEPARPWDFGVLAPAGAWRSTMTDMLRFLEAHLTPSRGPLSQAVELAIQSRRPTGAPDLSIGLGWHILTRGSRSLIWHNGETGGYHSFAGFDRSTGANVVVLSNSATDIDDIGLHILDPSIPLAPAPPQRAIVSLTEIELERYVGRYEITPEFSIVITRIGDRLFAQATGQPRFRLFAATPARFFLKSIEAELGFEIGERGKATHLTLYQNGQETRAVRVD